MAAVDAYAVGSCWYTPTGSTAAAEEALADAPEVGPSCELLTLQGKSRRLLPEPVLGRPRPILAASGRAPHRHARLCLAPA